jgi:hypothetical protein
MKPRASLRRRKERRCRAPHDGGNRKDLPMTDAQFGLLIAAPIIAGFALMLYRMGVLQGAGTLSAVSASVVIAAVLFFGQ